MKAALSILLVTARLSCAVRLEANDSDVQNDLNIQVRITSSQLAQSLAHRPAPQAMSMEAVSNPTMIRQLSMAPLCCLYEAYRITWRRPEYKQVSTCYLLNCAQGDYKTVHGVSGIECSLCSVPCVVCCMPYDAPRSVGGIFDYLSYEG